LTIRGVQKMLREHGVTYFFISPPKRFDIDLDDGDKMTAMTYYRDSAPAVTDSSPLQFLLRGNLRRRTPELATRRTTTKPKR
jgi:hypothetical protein